MKAFAYVRFSSEGQRDESIDAQIRAIQDYARRYNIEIIKIFADKAESATTDNRTEFQKMFKIIENSNIEINYLLVHKLDRFARNKYDSAIYKRKLKLKEIKLISILEHLDDSPESVILESVLEGMAEYYSLNLARETMKGMQENAHNAKFNGGIPPYGYCIDKDNNYVINESEAYVVRYIFNEFVKGTGYKSIITSLNDKGFRSRKGKEFGKTSIHAILRNERYIGKYIFNKTHNLKQPNGKKVFKNNSGDKLIVIDNAIPSIIDKESFIEVQKIMDNNSKSFRSFKTKNIYLLSGKLYCEKCGSVLTGHTRKGGANGNSIYSSYACKKRDLKEIKKETIENLVLEYLEKELFNKESIDKIIKNIDFELNKFSINHEDDLKEFEKELKVVQKQISNIVQAITDGLYNPTMKEKMTELEEKKNNLILLIEEEKIKLTTSHSTDMVKEQLFKIRDLKSLNLEEQKKVVQDYIKKITINDDGYEIITSLKVVSVESSGNPIEYTMTTYISK